MTSCNNHFSIRDPLYGYIPLSEDERALLDTWPVQRLRKIRQLAHSYLVYPSATHSRFEHSLGTMHIAGRMAKSVDIFGEDITALRFAALLHDTGHGPLSHVFEDIVHQVSDPTYSHEEVTKQIIQYHPEVCDVLGNQVDKVLSVFSDVRPSVTQQILSGSLDADKIDYLRRDSYYAGVQYGVFDIERILYTIKQYQDKSGSYLVVQEKGIDSLESFRLARFLMHAQVYSHHTRVIADSMIQRALEISVREDMIDSGLFEMPQGGDIDQLNTFLLLHDASLISHLISSPHPVVQDLAKGVERRKLWKRGFQMNVSASDDPILKMKLLASSDNTHTIEEVIAEECRIDKEMIIARMIDIQNSLYRSPTSDMIAHKMPFLIMSEDGSIKQIDTFSSMRCEESSRMIFSIMCPPDYQQKVQGCAENIITENI